MKPPAEYEPPPAVVICSGRLFHKVVQVLGDTAYCWCGVQGPDYAMRALGSEQTRGRRPCKKCAKALGMGDE